jgi:uncharacterized membrane protein YvlD (DUF360 family)
MNYLKSLLFNFLIVFFSNHLIPGIDVVVQKKLPHLGGDLLFAVGLGLLNSLIYPMLKVLNRKSSMTAHIAIFSITLNFGAYALLKLLPFGIQISSLEGYLFPALAVTIVSFLTNLFEMRARRHPHCSNSEQEPPTDP